jgi:GntR family transcriptional repressor for pyruvate dehydrogenase complex
MAVLKTGEAALPENRRLVGSTAARMRDLIFDLEPDAFIGSLPDLAKLLGVGIATVQQAARVLEHEGLLAVRRGPGGGYFGARPDAAALERSVATYLRVRGSNDYEALEMMTLLDCELMPAAAACEDLQFFEQLRALRNRIADCRTGEERVIFEDDLHAILFKMVNRPLIELLANVSMHYYRSSSIPRIFDGDDGLSAWAGWRYHIIDAILARDPELARFEAERHRRELLRRIKNERHKTA